jgi:hypothetical protein
MDSSRGDDARLPPVIGIMPRMTDIPATPAGLVPLARPLMTGEVLDAAFRLFRAGLLRTLPYSGLAVLVLELPTLYETFLRTRATGSSAWDRGAILVIAMLLGVALLGVITLRLHAISRGLRPRFRAEIIKVLSRWSPAVIATLAAFGFPLLLGAFASIFNPMYGTVVLLVLMVPILWPSALFASTLPAFWCDNLGPLAAIAKCARVSRRRTWRMVGALLATACMVAVFYVLAAILVGMMAPMLGRADLFLLAAVSSMMWLVVGALGVPFVIAVLIVAYEDLKLRDEQARGAPA